ncbi:hypothetical protein DNHGIG_30670 [Collibacillus ludicampi]|uniref:Uncharacterized protein n=1 Tax=Collibacillus ludicampi TaxID=2771369 RepID=A0AAV4LIR0_9BACL|nr:hypothetical protein [Collibacillus ludicampi]GIM47518.1 hypothetical protein DNHGIG_30670 [Collibacillus ludicampi]
MSEIFFHTGDRIDAHDYQRLEELLPRVQGKDVLRVMMEGSDSIQADALFDLLEQNGFERHVKGGHQDHFMIIARRKNG